MQRMKYHVRAPDLQVSASKVLKCTGLPSNAGPGLLQRRCTLLITAEAKEDFMVL